MLTIKKRLITVLICFASTSALVGCGDKQGGVAKVNERVIGGEEFSAYMQVKRIPQQNVEKKEAVLVDYLNREALADFIAKSDVVDRALIDAEVNEFKKQLLISRYFEQLLKDKVNEQALRNYYAANTAQFESKQANVSHILIRTNKKMSDIERQALLTRAQDVYGKVVSGKSFEELAAEYSEDKVSAKKGGGLGWLKEGAIDPLFSEKVFAMKEGDISEPFATTYGFHVVRLNQAPKTVKLPFEKVKGDIRYQLRQQAKEAEMEKINSQSKIEIF